MPRIRSIHPSLFTDEQFMELTVEAPLAVPVLIGLWTEADDNGVFEWKPLRLKVRLLPAAAADINVIMQELLTKRFVIRFEHDGREYGAVRNFRKFQKPNRPNPVHPLPTEIARWVGLPGAASPNCPDPGNNRSEDRGIDAPDERNKPNSLNDTPQFSECSMSNHEPLIPGEERRGEEEEKEGKGEEEEQQSRARSPAAAAARPDGRAAAGPDRLDEQPASPPPRPQPGDPDWIERGNRVLEAAGINPASWTGHFAELHRWIADGIDLERTILPVVAGIAERQLSRDRRWRPASLRYFDRAIREAHAEQPAQAPPPAREKVWRGLCLVWLREQRWGDEALYGPPPTSPDCRVPDEIRAEFPALFQPAEAA